MCGANRVGQVCVCVWCGPTGWCLLQGYTPHIVGWLKLWHAPRQGQNWHTDEATLWRQSVTLLPEQRLGQGWLSLYMYMECHRLWQGDYHRERERERVVGRVGQKHFHVAHTRTRNMNLFFVLLWTQQVNDVVWLSWARTRGVSGLGKLSYNRIITLTRIL